MSCRRASQLISESMDRPLSRGERFSLRFHLLVCRLCKRYQQQLLLLRAAMKTQLATSDELADAASATLSPEARQRIAQAISRES